MAGHEYSAVGGSGKLKLKGSASKVKDGRVDKKKKKDKERKERKGDKQDLAPDADAAPKGPGDEDIERGEAEEETDEKRPVYKTEAERKYEEQRKKKLNDRLLREGVKTHKERVQELNRYLSTLSEHHDMPKIGPG
ncbi:hypothetical protein BGW36DRAFT_358049 [Talaromyces proteolyticus]|uniref:DUF1754-domain-containing protein n=1 Tax=Talaromyces proteolyticus TaxID=1131652 RepID=A0AAD4KSS5_9EURO|nr:uncharacterized protein BGW36DRAFT_358049 [Talaromyces proteolyticus]KAH8698513.1 hypothetical protein BGW36DRAFT_358049 [Talaromyces proteolyticus]